MSFLRPGRPGRPEPPPGPGADAERRILRAIRDAARATERSTRRQLDAMFSQVEALLWLRDVLALERPLPPTRGWAASPDLLVELVRQIETIRPHAVVDVGSGVSTIVIAAALRRSGHGRVVALDHDAGYAARTGDELARQGLSDIAEVMHAPLGEMDVRGERLTWYTVAPDALPRDIGLVVVDGPPGPSSPLARYPALPVLVDRLVPDAVVILDDGARPDEREIVRRWQEAFAPLEAVELPLEKGAWLLRRGRSP